MATRRRKKKSNLRKKKIILVCEIIIILILLLVAFFFAKYNRLGREDFDDKNLGIAMEMTGYTNIALFGLDARDVSQLGKGTHSDSIIIASINNETKEIKLVSVYRDTFLNQSDSVNNYNKATQAYFAGGPQQSVAMLNTNLDLDIKDYVSVNFLALVKAIDMLGGIDMEVTSEELDHLNNYVIGTSEATGIDSPPVSKSGNVHLNGVQAVSYARIRFTAGDDYKRTERQRLVLSKLFEKAKKADLFTLNKVVDTCIPLVSTSLGADEILGLASSATKYKLTETAGFPFDKQAGNIRSVGKGDCVWPIGLEDNVIQLHEFLFPDEKYTPSNTVKGFSKKIIEMTGLTPKKDK